MSDLILWDILSLDGYFEGPNGEIDWFEFDPVLEQYVIDTQLAADTLLFGRKTYEGMAAYWPSAEGQSYKAIAEFMNKVPKVVFSRTLATADWHNTRVVQHDVPKEVSRLKQESGGDIFVYGSADFAATLIAHGLVDEYRFGISPVLLGAGTPFFKDGYDRISMRLVETRPLKSGVVILHYRPEPQSR